MTRLRNLAIGIAPFLILLLLSQVAQVWLWKTFTWAVVPLILAAGLGSGAWLGHWLEKGKGRPQ